MTNKFWPRRTKQTRFDKHERLMLIVLGFASIWEGLVMVLSLGFLTVDTRAWVLFDLSE